MTGQHSADTQIPPHDNLSPAMREALQRELDAEELLLWAGAPTAGSTPPYALFFFCMAAISAVFFAAIICIEQWERAAHNPPIDVSCVVLPSLIATMLIIVVVWVTIVATSRVMTQRTCFAVTPSRVLVITLGLWSSHPRARSVEPGHPLTIVRVEGKGGVGNILIHPARSSHPLALLWGVADARGVESLIRRTFNP